MSTAAHQVFSDPTALIARIGELVMQKRQFAVSESDGRWTLAYGGPALGRRREDGKVEVINE